LSLSLNPISVTPDDARRHARPRTSSIHTLFDNDNQIFRTFRRERSHVSDTSRGLSSSRYSIEDPPAGSPQRLIYLAPVLLHPRLIEARRSCAERISGGLEDVVTVTRVCTAGSSSVDESRACRAAGDCILTLNVANVRVALVGFVGGGPCSCTAIHGAIYGHRGGLWAPVMAPVRTCVICVLSFTSSSTKNRHPSQAAAR